MKRLPAIILWITLIAACAIPGVGQQSGSTSATTASAQEAVQPARYYRLNFTIRERSEDAVISERSYSLGVATAGSTDNRDWWSLRAGTKVPAGGNYVDVGFNVDVRVADLAGALQLRLKAELSSLPTGEPSTNSMPVIRQMRVDEAVVVPVGKPTVVYTGEDHTKHRFELEVTAVRM